VLQHGGGRNETHHLIPASTLKCGVNQISEIRLISLIQVQTILCEIKKNPPPNNQKRICIYIIIPLSPPLGKGEIEVSSHQYNTALPSSLFLFSICRECRAYNSPAVSFRRAMNYRSNICCPDLIRTSQQMYA